LCAKITVEGSPLIPEGRSSDRGQAQAVGSREAASSFRGFPAVSANVALSIFSPPLLRTTESPDYFYHLFELITWSLKSLSSLIFKST
jgi:hypothetical protein